MELAEVIHLAVVNVEAGETRYFRMIGSVFAVCWVTAGINHGLQKNMARARECFTNGFIILVLV